MRLEYIFDDYTNVSEVRDRVDQLLGKFEGDVPEYDGKNGLVLKSGTQIKIQGKITTMMKFSNTLCYFFGFKYEEPLSEEFRLLSKGEKDKKHSFFVYLQKKKDLRKVMVKVGYETSKGSPESSTFLMDDPIPPNIYNEL
jgi:hypothetical protein